MKDKILRKGLDLFDNGTAHFDVKFNAALKQVRSGPDKGSLYLSLTFETGRTGENVKLKFTATFDPTTSASFNKLPASAQWVHDVEFFYFYEPVEFKQPIALDPLRVDHARVDIRSDFHFVQPNAKKFGQDTKLSLKVRNS